VSTAPGPFSAGGAWLTGTTGQNLANLPANSPEELANDTRRGDLLEGRTGTWLSTVRSASVALPGASAGVRFTKEAKQLDADPLVSARESCGAGRSRAVSPAAVRAASGGRSWVAIFAT
jgi:hypothetical protein